MGKKTGGSSRYVPWPAFGNDKAYGTPSGFLTHPLHCSMSLLLAGIRTMALVSLGSCLFTINSAFAFLDGPMEWDASRISAAIPSGVGFLGAGLIFKQAEKDEKSGDVTHGTSPNGVFSA